MDVRKKECSCGLWEVSGIPCCHAIVALKHQGLDVFQIFDDCYKKELFMTVYNNVLYPVNGMTMWPTSLDGLELDPPAYVVQPGRPKKTRKRDTDEGKNHGRKLRKYVTMHCRRCGNTGHNAATCKKPASNGQNASNSVHLQAGLGNEDGAHGVYENPTHNPTIPESRPKKQAVNTKFLYVIPFDLSYNMYNCVSYLIGKEKKHIRISAPSSTSCSSSSTGCCKCSITSCVLH